MAILETLPGVEVAISVDGVDLQEYIDTDDEDNPGTVTKYIKAITGKILRIRYKVSEDFTYKGDSILFEFYADGVKLGRNLVSHESTSRVTNTGDNSHFYPGDKSSRTLEFKKLVVNDSDHSLEDLARASKLGVLEVKIFHTTRVECTQIESENYRTDDSSKTVSDDAIPKKTVSKKVIPEKTNSDKATSDGTIPEKALKGREISHFIVCEPTATKARNATRPPRTTRARKPASYRNERINGKNSTDGKFIFKYRSEKALANLMIIPRVPRAKKRINEEGDDNPGARKKPRISPSAYMELNEEGGFTETNNSAHDTEGSNDNEIHSNESADPEPE